MHTPSSLFELEHGGSKNRLLKNISSKEHLIPPRQFLFTILSSKAYAMVSYCSTDVFPASTVTTEFQNSYPEDH